MSHKELSRVAVIAATVNGTLKPKEASEQLNTSIRHLRRLCQRYKMQGPEGLVHQSRGRPSCRRINDSIRRQVIDLVRAQYDDFGPTLAQEMLAKRHDLQVSREWLRKLLIGEGLWKARLVKRVAVHRRRQRRSRVGELEQLDGSYHRWFEDRGQPCCLLVIIDDATSRLMALKFVEHETTEAYFDLVRTYMSRYGRPVALYSDRHSVFKVSGGEIGALPRGETQFQRAMKELDVEMIHAKSPQAKGRVERANGTLQRRLVKMMRLERISNMEEGNAYLEKFMKEFNHQFAISPSDEEDAHRVMPLDIDVECVFALREYRKVTKDLSVHYKGLIYQITEEKSPCRLVGTKIEVIEQSGRKVILRKRGVKLKYSLFTEMPVKETIMDRKHIEAFLDSKKPLTTIQKHRKKMVCCF